MKHAYLKRITLAACWLLMVVVIGVLISCKTVQADPDTGTIVEDPIPVDVDADGTTDHYTDADGKILTPVEVIDTDKVEVGAAAIAPLLPPPAGHLLILGAAALATIVNRKP